MSGPRKLPLMSATAVEGRARICASRLDRRVGSGCACCGYRVARLVSSGRLSPYFHLFCFCHGLRNSEAKAVRNHLQAVPARHTGRCQSLPFSVNCHCPPPLRGSTADTCPQRLFWDGHIILLKNKRGLGALTCLEYTFAGHTPPSPRL